jgi:hypothetical protein
MRKLPQTIMTLFIAACAIWLAVGPTRSWAARGAVVDVEGLEMRRGPGQKYGLIQRLSRGMHLVVSNYPTEGFYKVRTLKGEVGFVQADSLILAPLKGEAPDARLSPSPIAVEE